MDYIVANFAQSLPMSLPGLLFIYFFADKVEGLAKTIFYGAIASSGLPLISSLLVGVPNLGVAAFAGIWGGLCGYICKVVMRGRKKRLAASQRPKASPSSRPKPASNNSVLELRPHNIVKKANVGNAIHSEYPATQGEEASPIKESVEKRLERVKKLLEDDLISSEDAAEKRKKILDDL